MKAIGIDLIICADCWPKFIAALRAMNVDGPPGSWTDDPDDASECDLCGVVFDDKETP